MYSPLNLFGYWTLNKHYYYVNSTQISDIIKRLRFGKSDRVDDLYSDTFKHGTSLLFQLLLIVCYVMDMHPPVFLHGAVIPITKNTKLNLSSSSTFSKTWIKQLCLYNLRT